MMCYGSASLVFGKRALLGQVVLEPCIDLAILIYHVMSPDPFEPPPRCSTSLWGSPPCKTSLFHQFVGVLRPAKPRIALPDAGADLVVPERGHEGPFDQSTMSRLPRVPQMSPSPRVALTPICFHLGNAHPLVRVVSVRLSRDRIHKETAKRFPSILSWLSN